MVVLAILMLVVQVSSELVNIDVSVLPNEAHGEDTKFTLYGSVLETMEQGSSIWMYIPQEVAELQNGLSNTCSFSAPAGVTASCSYQLEGDGRILYKFENINQEIAFGEDLQVTIDNFNNPISTAVTESFEFRIYRQNGALVSTYTQDIYLLLVASDLSIGLSLTSSSDVVGTKDASLTVSFTLVHDIEPGQYVAIKFPYVSDEAPDRQKVSVLSQGASSTITAVTQNLPSSMPIEWDDSTQTLYILINIFVDGPTDLTNGFIPSNTLVNDGIVSFTLYPINNPISTARLSGFIVSTMTSSKDGYIETSLGNEIYLKVYSPYIISQLELKLTMNETQVQKYSRYQFELRIDLPIDSLCIFEFQFPADYFFFEDEQFQSFTGAGAVGGGSLLYNRVDQETYTLFTTESGFTSYTNNNVPFIMRFDMIKNSYFAVTTPSIILNIYDSQMNRIAENTMGLEATIKPGQIYLSPLEAHPSNFVLDQTYLHIKLQPESEVDSDAKLVITFPPEQGLVLPSPCVLSDFGTLVRSDASCESDQSKQMTLTITKLLRQAYAYNSAVKIEFDVANVTLPLSSKPFGEFTFQIFSLFNGEYKLIDQGSDSGLFQPQQRELNFASAAAQNQKAYETGSYIFQLKLSAFIPQEGLIQVVMSDDVSIQSSTSCSNFGPQISSSAYCEADTTSQTLTIKNGFSQSGYTGSDTIQFQVNNIRNPRSLAPSGYFKLYTLDVLGYIIEQSIESAFVEMTQSQSLTSITIGTDSDVVGQESDYYISFTTKVPLFLGDYLEVTVPAQIQSYVSRSLDYCQGLTNLVQDLSCYAISQSTMKVIIQPSSSQIQQFSILKFMVSEFKNPNTTAETENFDIKIYDSQQYLVQITDDNAEASVQMEQPCPLVYAQVTHSSRAAFETTLFSFTIRIIHELPPGSVIRVDWPEEIKVDEDADFKCVISTRLEGLSRACRPQGYYVLLEDINDDYLSAGKTIQLSLYGLKNSKFAAATSSFVVTTMVDRFTAVDRASEGLVVENSCDWPCKSCDQLDPSICRTCKSTSDYPIFHENQCLRECPRDGGFFEANLRCNKCDESCQECDGTPNFCTSCPLDKYLLGHSCYDQCPTNSIVNEYKRLCVLCEAPCDTCENAVDQCTSCMMSEELRYFWRGECRTECPKDITLWIGPESYCTRCNRNCATCSDGQATCTSCHPGMKLDTFDQVCKYTCPEEISVDMGDTCEPCDNRCATCASTAKDECLTCHPGTAYYEEETTCVTHCPYGTAKISVNGILECVDCDEGCLDCQGETSYCTACDDTSNFLFHQFTCVSDSCPKDFKRLSSTRNTCVPKNEYCKYGYAFNDQAICELAVAECPEGTILNQTLDKCVVLPGIQIPFLFLGLAFLWTLYVLASSYKKELFKPISLISQLLLGYDIILQACTIVLIWLCSLVGLDLLSTINYSVLAFVIIENAILTVWILKRSMVEDQAFKYWTQYNQKATMVFLSLGTLWSFKINRAFYSKAFKGSKSFDAAFDTKFKTIVKPLFLVSMVHFSCFQLPLMMTDIYTIAVIPPKYRNQITTVAFDNLILQLAVFALEICEFNIMRQKSKAKRIDKEETNFLPTYKKMRRHALDQIQVKSNYQDDESFQESSKLDMDQSHLPLNILDWEHASTTRYKQQLSRYSKQTPTTIKQQPVDDEILLLESIVTRLQQKKKFKSLSSINNIPDKNRYSQNNTKQKRKDRIDVIKANKQKFSLIRRRKFVIRDVKKTIEVSPRSSEKEAVIGRSKSEGPGDVRAEEKWERLKLENVNEHRDDRKDYKSYLKEYKEIHKEEREKKVRSGETRLNKSFDDEIMRADYEFMGDDLSEHKSKWGDSAMTFPFCKDDHRIDLDDPREMADLDVFRDRIKRKFHFNNCGANCQQEAIFRLPGAMATQTQQAETKDPFDTSESSISEMSWVFSDEIEEQLYHLTKNVAQDLVEAAVILNISDSSSDSMKSEEMANIAFDKKMRASEQNFEDLQRNGGQILQDHLDPAVQRLVSQSSMRTTQTPFMASSHRQFSRMASQKEGSEDPPLPLPPLLSLKEIVALKLKEQVGQVQKEMEQEGLNEEILSGNEVDLARSELERLQELSLGKPSDEEDDQKIKDTAVNDNSSAGASDFQKFSAVSQSKTNRKNRRLQKLENAYGMKKKNHEIMSLKDTKQMKKKRKILGKPLKVDQKQDEIEDNELFPELPEKSRQITERHHQQQAEPLSSSRSSSNSGFRGSLGHGRSLSIPFDDQNNEQMREFISGQINNAIAKRGQNGKVKKDRLEDRIVDQEELNLEQEMNEILKNAESPKNLNISKFKDLFAPDDEVKHFPTTQKKNRQSLELSLIGDDHLKKSQNSSIENEWKNLNLSDKQTDPEDLSMQLSKLPKVPEKGKKFDKFEHLLFENIIEQKIEKEIQIEKKRQEEEDQKAWLQAPKAVAFQSSKKIFAENKKGNDSQQQRSKMQSSRMLGNSLMISQLAKSQSKIDSIKDIYNSTRPYQQPVSKRQIEMSSSYSNFNQNQKRNPFLAASSSNPKLKDVLNNDAFMSGPYLPINRDTNFASNKRNSEVLSVNRSTSALGQTRGLSQIMKHNYMSSSGALPPYKPDRDSSMGRSDKLSQSVQKPDFHLLRNPVAQPMSENSDKLKDSDANISENSAKTLPKARSIQTKLRNNPSDQNFGNAVAKFSQGMQVARELARKKNAEEILKN